MNYIVTAYYTKGTIYEEYAENFILSLKKFGLFYEITPIDDFKDWYKGMQYKPTFLKQMLEKHYPHSIVYVDIDAIFCRYPNFFDHLDRTPEVNIALHVLDHSKYRRKEHPPELLSGTIFLKNTKEVKEIINRWIYECSQDSKLWDQRALERVLKNYRYHLLPEEYCMIFDYMSSIKDPVIKHFQASRVARRNSGVCKKGQGTPRKTINKRTPRRVEKEGVIRIKRS